ncbi:MAG TPA: hypothetical protein VGM06_20010 [Polyangiaceae bacterium]
MSAAVALQNGPSSLGPPRAAQAKRCGVCQRAYDADAWKALPSVATLPAAAIKPHLTVPTEWAIELRSCKCGAVLASLYR